MQSIKVSGWLKNNNINHIIVSIWNYQIIDYHELCKLIEKDNLVIIIDEHKKYGSIGNDIETNLKEKNINNIKLLCIDNEVITDTGDYEYLIEKYKIDSNAIKKIIVEEITNEKK